MTLASYIAAMPKVELHVHLEGSIGATTLLELAARNGIRLSVATEDEVRALCSYRDFRQFVEVILLHARCLQRPEDFVLAVERMGRQMSASNIRYAEVFWAPQIYVDRGVPPLAILDALQEGGRRAQEGGGPQLRWIPDVVRSREPPDGEMLAVLLGDEARRRGVVGLGLGGIEADHPPQKFRDLFRCAADAGLPACPHAGEFAGPASVRGALDALGAKRIGHGVRSVEDAELLRHLVENKITLEVCPTSNLALHVCPSYEAHPLRRLVEAGCRVTINTDDPALFGTNLNDEYRHAVEDCGLTLDQLETAALNAVRACHAPTEQKDAWLSSFRNEYACLREGFNPEP
jgi:aminodeoxyfutalosine deaminase